MGSHNSEHRLPRCFTPTLIFSFVIHTTTKHHAQQKGKEREKQIDTTDTEQYTVVTSTKNPKRENLFLLFVRKERDREREREKCRIFKSYVKNAQIHSSLELHTISSYPTFHLLYSSKKKIIRERATSNRTSGFCILNRLRK